MIQIGAALWLCLMVAAAAPPDLLRGTNPNRRAPLWVSASAVVGDDGELAPEHFEPHELRLLQRQQPCFGESPAEIAAPSDSLQSLAKARAVIDGTVTKRAVGFFEGKPGALLSIRVERSAPREPAFPIPDEVLVYFPEADFIAGGQSHCIRAATHPARPRPGDRILIFAYGPPVDTTGRLLYVQASKHLVVETADGRLLPPVAIREELAASELRNIVDVVARLEQYGLRMTKRGHTSAK